MVPESYFSCGLNIGGGTEAIKTFFFRQEIAIIKVVKGYGIEKETE